MEGPADEAGRRAHGHQHTPDHEGQDVGHRLYVEVLDYAPSTLTHRERLLLAVLAEDARDETRTTWSRVEDPKILRRAQVSRSGLYAGLKSLVAKGVLERVTAGQKNAAAKYRITVQRPGNPDTDRLQRPGIPDTDGSVQCPVNPDAESAEAPQRPESPDTEPTSVSGNPGRLLSRERVNTRPSAPPAPDAFDSFWAAYPRKVAKGAARRAWAAALKRGATPAHITAAATRHAAQWRALGTAPQYIPYPATWLTGERYDDAPEPVPAHNQPPLPGAPQRYTDPAERGVF